MLTPLSLDEIRYIYSTYMVVDFPQDELKPLSSIERMVADGICSCFAIYDKDVVVAYAFLCEYDGYVLVDYLAVNSDMRGEGIGSRLLKLLKERLDGKTLLVECEDIDFAENSSEAETRKRRISFYTASGFKVSSIKTVLFGVNYVILTYPGNCNTIAEGLEKVYRKMLGEESFHKHLKIYN